MPAAVGSFSFAIGTPNQAVRRPSKTARFGMQALAKEEGLSREYLRQRLNSAKRRLASRMIERRELVT